MKLKKGDLIKPKKGQVWKRKRDGLLLLMVGGHNGDTYRCVNLLNRKIQHHITKKTLNIYWQLIGTENNYDG